MMRTKLLIAVAFALTGCGGSPAQPVTAPPTSKSPFIAEQVQGLGDPEVVVENRSDKAFTIALTGASQATLEVPPHEKRSVRLKPGSYAFKASADETAPAEGQHAFAKDMRYSWVFVIVMKRDDDPEFAGKGWHCFDVKTEPLPYYVCARDKARCQKAHDEPVKPGEPPVGECTAHQTVYGFFDEARNVLVFTLAMEPCEKIRATYLKQAPDASKVGACLEKP